MTVTITKSVGEGADNSPHDVMQVDNLLSKVGMLGPICATPQARADAIRKFQQIWNLRSPLGNYDGRVDPHGKTLQRLNETASPLKLHPITLEPIGKGGFVVSFTPDPPPKPYMVRLGFFATAAESIDITGKDRKCAVSAANLPELLRLIDRHSSWGRPMPVKLFVMLDNRVISESVPVVLPAPVQPHNGQLLPLDQKGNGAKLKYVYDPSKSTYGRMLQKVDGVNGFFFKYGGEFETNDVYRGLDCTTYAGSVCGVDSAHMKDGSTIAAAASATKCTLQKPEAAGAAKPAVTNIDLEATDPKNVKEFFEQKPEGYFLLWMDSHVVLVTGSTVYEFAQSKAGYAETGVEEWLKPYHTKKLTVRKLPGKPPMAT